MNDDLKLLAQMADDYVIATLETHQFCEFLNGDFGYLGLNW